MGKRGRVVNMYVPYYCKWVIVPDHARQRSRRDGRRGDHQWTIEGLGTRFGQAEP